MNVRYWHKADVHSITQHCFNTIRYILVSTISVLEFPTWTIGIMRILKILNFLGFLIFALCALFVIYGNHNQMGFGLCYIGAAFIFVGIVGESWIISGMSNIEGHGKVYRVALIGASIAVVSSVLGEFIPDIDEAMKIMTTIGTGLIFVGVIIGMIKIIQSKTGSGL